MKGMKIAVLGPKKSAFVGLVLILFCGTVSCGFGQLYEYRGYDYARSVAEPGMGVGRRSASADRTAGRLFELAKRAHPALAWNACLADIAARRAEALALSGRFSHRDPGTGKNPAWDMISTSCFNWRYVGENLVRGNVSPDGLHRTLMDSPSHRANIMDPRYKLMGVGCYGDLCVELFAGR
jgi:uncharacterized protein YkwD